MNMRPHAHGPTNYGPILLSIPALGTMLLIFWVGQMNLLQSPFQSLVLVYFGVAIISGLITLVEVKQVNPNSAVQWCVLVSLFWPLAFPIYLLERISFGFPRYICDLEFAIGCDQAASVWSDQKNERKSFHFAERGCQLKNHMSCARIAHTKNNIQEQFDILSVSCSNFEGMACFAIAEGLSTLPNPDPKNLKRLYSLSCKLGVAAGCEKVGESLPKFFTGQ